MVQIYKKIAKVRFFFRINKQFEEKKYKIGGNYEICWILLLVLSLPVLTISATEVMIRRKSDNEISIFSIISSILYFSFNGHPKDIAERQCLFFL